METSIFLAKVIGLVSVISTAAIMLRYEQAVALEEEAARNPLNVYLSGFVFLVLGALLVVGHSVWVLDWRVVITILGWLMLLKGVYRILFPDLARRLTEKKKEIRAFILGEAAVFLVGLYLLYHGFVAN